MAAELQIAVAAGFFYMPDHLFEVIFTSVGLFLAPLIVVAAMVGALTLADRLFHFLQEHQHPR